jgi:hypothetical protein
MADEALWKRRFLLFMAARITGALVFLAGAAIAFTDLIREGGWLAVGAIVMVLGIADAIFAPKLLRKQWEIEDRRSGGRM